MQQYKHAQSSVGEGKPPVRSCDDGVALGVHAGKMASDSSYMEVATLATSSIMRVA